MSCKTKLILVTLALAAATTANAQSFTVKPALAAGGVTGCAALPPEATTVTPSNPVRNAEAQQLIADAEAAALQGEHIAARDAFTKAAALEPSNARVAYYLGREHEALNENTEAVKQYCRYLALLPTAPDADDVRGRVVRLTPVNELARLEEARAQFQSAVALLSRKQYAAADSVFGFVATQMPAAPEPFFNRGLARAATGDREGAMQSFERYLALAPRAADRGPLREAMARLPDRVYSPGQAFASGVFVPGLGQMTTGRPVLGVLALGAVGAAVGLAVRSETETQTRQFNDPFGQSYTDTITTSSRPLLTAGLITAGVVWLGAALESIAYARGSRARAESIIAHEPARVAPGMQLGVTRLSGGRVGVGLTYSGLPRLSVPR